MSSHEPTQPPSSPDAESPAPVSATAPDPSTSAEAPPSADALIEQAAKLETDSSASEDTERRQKKRVPYRAPLAIVLIGPTGEKSRPLVIRAKNISIGGLRLAGRQMFHVGSFGAVLMRRSDGRRALVGVKVVHCAYAGNLEHVTGLQFIPLPREMTADDFLDDHGRPVSLDEETLTRHAA